MDVGLDRVAELHLSLIEERDDRARARIHLELATLAVREGKLEQAARHFREALLFDRSLERARVGLEELGELSSLRPALDRRRSMVRSLLERFRGAKRKPTSVQ